VWRKQSHSVYAASTSTDAMTSIGATDIRNIEVVTPSFDLAPELVLGTDRIATVPTILARKYAALLPIKLLRVPVEISPLMEVLQWHRTYDHDPALKPRHARIAASRFRQRCARFSRVGNTA